MIETWKDITGYEGLYRVSNMGNVYSEYIKRVLKPGTDKNGYKQVSLQRNGREEKRKIHRLVANAFLENQNHLPWINHKDENKANNNLDNLEWCTPKYNSRYSWARAIKGTNIKTGNALVYEAMLDCKTDGFDERSVIRCLQGEHKQHHGYTWEYI